MKNFDNMFEFDTEKHRRTPIGTHEKITRGKASNSVGYTLYNVGACARYQACPKESHLLAVKKIIDLRYILTETQLANIFTKGLDTTRFKTLKSLLDLYVF